jgi:hypothetical protein
VSRAIRSLPHSCKLPRVVAPRMARRPTIRHSSTMRNASCLVRSGRTTRPDHATG